MILYRNPRTRELFTEDELRGLFDEQIQIGRAHV